ncbi:polynucleotide 5'-hydroxyl-kinase grc3 [Galendromus occidentalis]|uniref:Polynucleotide 5'-hydroxyl-kinase grc3 n=1 Tax=Galendromus occidentalis TaxID=34638 RepID=A0AAJ6VYE7_9ACAR|nr:polynucleotide 5'-hydroxyl-kinase grc3 [Galendromus occidentalis]
MGKVAKPYRFITTSLGEMTTSLKSNMKRKVGDKRGFSVSLSSRRQNRSKRSRDTRGKERSISSEPCDLLAQRIKSLCDSEKESPSDITGVLSNEDDDAEDLNETDRSSSDGTFRSCSSFTSSSISKSNTPQGESLVSCVPSKQAGLKMFQHHGIMYIVMNEFACAAFGGSGYMLILQGAVGLYGVKVSASENLVLPLESVPGSCIVLTNRGQKSQTGNLTENLERIGASRSLNKAKDLLTRYPTKTIVAIQGRPDNFTNLKPNFSSADDSTPENSWESLGFYVFPLQSNGVPSNRRFDDVVASVSKVAAREPVRIVLGGSRNSGKSSLIRALCNRFLLERIRNDSSDSERTTCAILVLDLDPGQTEFTPPGCVSLVEVTETLMGPPSSHQVRPEKSFLVGGGSTPGAHPDMYVRSVELLMQHLHDSNCANYILLVNTMGWLNGIGELLFGSILNVVEPTRLLSLDADFKVPTTAWPCKEVICSPAVTQLSPLQSLFARDPYTKAVTAAMHREASIIGYFKGSAIMEKTPNAIPWSKVALHEISGVAPNQEILYLMNGNMVALCRVPDRLLLKSKSKPLFPKFFQNDRKGQGEAFECLGFGIVRAVDPVNKWIYIATPESSEIFESVNALIYNSISLPSFFYVNQRSEVAPYVQGDRSRLELNRALATTVSS